MIPIRAFLQACNPVRNANLFRVRSMNSRRAACRAHEPHRPVQCKNRLGNWDSGVSSFWTLSFECEFAASVAVGIADVPGEFARVVSKDYVAHNLREFLSKRFVFKRRIVAFDLEFKGHKAQ